MIESIPNISEGRNSKLIRQIVGEIEQSDGADVIDYSSDSSHHRTVFTITGIELENQIPTDKIFHTYILLLKQMLEN